jgi:AraC-like DNA-binding protein
MRKPSGFEGELIIDIPKAAQTKCVELPLVNHLFVTRMGFYPKALHHYYQRPRGISQVILIYCVGGKGWIQLAKKKVYIQAGEIFVIPKEIPHSYRADDQNPWTIYWFHLAGTDCSDATQVIMGYQKEPHHAVQVGFSNERNALFKQIASTFLKGYSASNLLFANLSLTYYLATFVSPEHFQNGSTIPTSLSASDLAIEFMQQNLSKSLTLEQIAQSANLSVSFFSRKFKQETGYPPIEYFNQLRLQKACQLLHFSQLRVNEIAVQIGIEDPFYFSRLFKQQMGVSPAKYRKNEEAV